MQAFIQNKAFLKALQKCLKDSVQQDVLQDKNFQRRPTSRFRPSSWQQLVAPIVALVREGLEHFVASRYDPDFQALAQAAQAAVASKIPGLTSAKDPGSR